MSNLKFSLNWYLIFLFLLLSSFILTDCLWFNILWQVMEVIEFIPFLTFYCFEAHFLWDAIPIIDTITCVNASNDLIGTNLYFLYVIISFSYCGTFREQAKTAQMILNINTINVPTSFLNNRSRNL